MRLQQIKKWDEPENPLAEKCEADESEITLILVRNPDGKERPFCSFGEDNPMLIANNYAYLADNGIVYAQEKAEELSESAARRFANNVFFYDSALDEWTVEYLLRDGYIFAVKYKDNFWRINHD